jgi:hypothetical protein
VAAAPLQCAAAFSLLKSVLRRSCQTGLTFEENDESAAHCSLVLAPAVRGMRQFRARFGQPEFGRQLG